MAELYYPDIYFSNIKENILTNQKKETFEDKTSNIKYEDNVLSSFYYLNLINNYLSNKTKIVNGKMIKVKKSRPLNVTNDVVDILIDDYFETPEVKTIYLKAKIIERKKSKPLPFIDDIEE